MRAALDDLAAVVPDWLRAIAQPVWFERYEHRIEDYRLPKSQARREALALEIGADGFRLLDALEASDAPPACLPEQESQLTLGQATHRTMKLSMLYEALGRGPGALLLTQLLLGVRRERAESCCEPNSPDACVSTPTATRKNAQRA
jgi:hypothetical protein